MLAGDVTAAPSWWLLTLVVGPRRRSRGGGGRRPAGRRRLPPGGGTRQAAASRRLAAGRAGPIIWAALVWRLHGQHTPALLPPLLLLGLLAVVLSWTDLDVHRLPEQITLPALPSMVALLAITSAVTGDWAALGRAVLCGAGGYVFFFILVIVTAGGVGRGDATLAALVSIPTGYLGWSVSLTALTLGLAASGIIAVIILATRPHRRGAEMALGPYLLLGALAATLLAS